MSRKDADCARSVSDDVLRLLQQRAEVIVLPHRGSAVGIVERHTEKPNPHVGAANNMRRIVVGRRHGQRVVAHTKRRNLRDVRRC